MPEEDENLTMPHKALKTIKDELNKIKTAKGKSAPSKNMSESMDRLSRSINGLMHLFKEAANEMRIEEEAEVSLKEKIGPLLQRIDDIEDQNRKIAQGILVVADMVKELKDKFERQTSKIQPMQIRPMPQMPPMPRQEFIPPKFSPPMRSLPTQPPRFEQKTYRDLMPPPLPPAGPPSYGLDLGGQQDKKKKFMGLFSK